MAEGNVVINVVANADEASKVADELKKKFQDIDSDDGGSGRLDRLRDGAGKVATAVAGAVAAGTAAVASGVSAITAQATQAWSTYEQLSGGMKALFGDAYDTVMDNAERAYETMGMSANSYMQNVTGLSGALKHSIGDDYQEVARMADVAMGDIADNASVYGTDIGTITEGYMSLARGNYQMLDTVTQGYYAGTKTGLKQLIKDANEYERAQGRAGDLTVDSYADIVQAIHDYQEQMGVTGNAAKEAYGTVSGSLDMIKAAWENLLVALGNGEGVDTAIDQFLTSFGALATNIVPVAATVVDQLVSNLPALVQGVLDALGQYGPQLADTMVSAVTFAWDRVASTMQGLGWPLPTVTTDQVSAALQGVLDGVSQFAQSFHDSFSQAFGGDEATQALSDLGQAAQDLVDAAQPAVDFITGPLASALGTAVGDGLRLTLEGITDALQWLADNGADAIPVIGGVAAVVGTLAAGFAVLGASIGLVSLGGLVSTIPVVAGLMSAWGAVTTAVGDAWAFLSLAMEANPIGVVLVAVAAVVAALVYLYNTNETVRDAIDAAWQAIQSVVGAVVGAIVGFFTTTLPAAFQAVADFFTVTIPAAFQAFVDFMAGLPATIGAFIQQLPMLIVEGIGLLIGVVAGLVASLTVLAIQAGQAFLTNLVSFFMQLPGQVMAFLQSAVAFVASFAAQLAADAVQAGSSFLQGVMSFFMQLPGQLMAFLSSAIASIASFVAQVPGQAVAAGQGFLNGIRSGFQAAVSFVQGIPGQIMGFFSNAGSWLVNSGKALLDGFTSGIRRGFQAAQDAVSSGLDFIRGFFPFSPAKRGPFSGHGYTTYSGAALMRDFAGSIAGAVPSVASAVGDALGGVRAAVVEAPQALVPGPVAAPAATSVAGGPVTTYNLAIDGATVNGDEHVRGLFLDLLTELQRRAAMNVG